MVTSMVSWAFDRILLGVVSRDTGTLNREDKLLCFAFSNSATKSIFSVGI